MSPRAESRVEEKLKQFTEFLREAQKHEVSRSEAIKMMMKHARGQDVKV